VASNNRGVALYYRGAFDAARDAFLKAIELQTDYPEALNNLGLVYSRLGSEPDAIEAFRKALTLDPKMGEAYNNLGFLYHTSAQFDRAAQMFGLAIENAGARRTKFRVVGKVGPPGRDTRIGINIDQYQRLSPVSGRQFKGLRYGIAVTYGS